VACHFILMENINDHQCVHVDPDMKHDEATAKIARLEAQLLVIEEICADIRQRLDEAIEKGSHFMNQRNFLLDWIRERFGAAAQAMAQAGVRGEWMGHGSPAQEEWIGSPPPAVNAAMLCPNCGSSNVACEDVIRLDADCWHCNDCKFTWDDGYEGESKD
jgi:hypothetical protein